MKVVAFAAILVAGLAGWPGAGGARVGPARIQITAQEFTLTASRHTMKAGPAVVELYNLGEDAHDLVIQRRGAPRPVAQIPSQPSGGVADMNVNLKPGRYVAYCSLPGHRALGMQTTFTVVKHNPRSG